MTHPLQAPGDRIRFDGSALTAMFSAATRLFEPNVDLINSLNVFPVPDGDTGTNMHLTLRDMMSEVERTPSTSAGEVAAAMARGSLSGARGNSGVILSQFFKGMAVVLDGRPDFGTAELALALESAREHAYKSLAEPVEGTLLTVISSAAQAARRSVDAGDDSGKVLDSVCDAAEEAVALTPTMLPVLRRAGVVDAGGQGLSVILQAVRHYVRGEETEATEISPPAPVGVEVGAGTVSDEFLEDTEEVQYGYCTQFLIEGQDLDPDGVRDRMASLALSTVVVGDSSMVKVHVHAHDPGPVVSYAASLGTLGQVKIQNMDEQHSDYSAARRREAVPGPADESAALISVVAVAWGQGIEATFTEVGAAECLEAGDTMNPSVQQILDAVERAPSEQVIFLPNNRNIVPAAEQAVQLSGKELRVVPSTTIPQGVAAMLAFNPEKALDENVSEMAARLPSVRTGEVCHAVRAVELNGVSVREGQVIGLLERDLVAAGDEPDEVLVSLLQKADLSEGDLVTLYWGGPLTEADSDAARRRLEVLFPEVEVGVVGGGQPHYHYIVSIE